MGTPRNRTDYRRHGALGGRIATWLAQTYDSVHLLLVSRSGMHAVGASELVDNLRAKGGHVTVEACDVTDKAAVADVLQRIPVEQPLDAVFHVAGTSSVSTLTAVDNQSFISGFGQLKGDASAI